MKRLIGLLTVIFITSSVQLFAEEKIYQIGDIGPAGGFIVSRANVSGTWRYIEASKEDLNGECKWDYAMAACESSTEGGFDNWILPSKAVLTLMYENLKLKGKGNFVDDGKDDVYWSSSESNYYFAHFMYFRDGTPGLNNKYYTYYARCVRAF